MDRGQEIELAANTEVDGLNGLDGFDRTDMINMFGSGAEWADSHPKNPWISVKEQLPNVSQEVIVLTKNGKCVVSSMYIPKDCKGNILGSKEWKGSKTFKDSIVLWMTIPELTFDDILDANKDVLKRIKENGD